MMMMMMMMMMTIAVFGKLPEKVKENVLETDRDRLAHAYPDMEEFVFCKVTRASRCTKPYQTKPNQTKPNHLSNNHLNLTE